jgi:nitronate monooxygenase
MTGWDTPLCQKLGCRYPLVLAGMGGVSRAELVGAVTEAGGFGFLGMVREPPELIAREVEALRRAGHARFGVNLIPAATPPKLLEAELATCLALEVPVVALFWDIDRALVRRLRDAGTLVVYQVGSVEEGQEAVAAGAQVLIAQGVEAGGHVRGTTPLFTLLPALARAVDVPVLAAGGIVEAGDVAAALALGAQGAVLGTAMIATRESFAHDVHKARLLAARGEDTVLTDAFHINWPDGARVRVLDCPVTQGLRGDPWTGTPRVIGLDEGRPIYLFSTDSPLRSTTGDLEEMALYAGAGVGRLTQLTTAGRRLARLVAETELLLRLPGGRGEAELASPVCYAGISPEYMGYLDHAGLVAALEGLRRRAASALQAATRGSAPERRYTRWVLVLTALLTELEGHPPPPPEPAEAPSPDEAAQLVAGARALLPKVFEARVGQVLRALIDEAGGQAGAEADGAAAPAAGAGG